MSNFCCRGAAGPAAQREKQERSESPGPGPAVPGRQRVARLLTGYRAGGKSQILPSCLAFTPAFPHRLLRPLRSPTSTTHDQAWPQGQGNFGLWLNFGEYQSGAEQILQLLYCQLFLIWIWKARSSPSPEWPRARLWTWIPHSSARGSGRCSAGRAHPYLFYLAKMGGIQHIAIQNNPNPTQPGVC